MLNQFASLNYTRVSQTTISRRSLLDTDATGYSNEDEQPYHVLHLITAKQRAAHFLIHISPHDEGGCRVSAHITTKPKQTLALTLAYVCQRVNGLPSELLVPSPQLTV
jgi:hypothetical protein